MCHFIRLAVLKTLWKSQKQTVVGWWECHVRHLWHKSLTSVSGPRHADQLSFRSNSLAWDECCFVVKAGLKLRGILLPQPRESWHFESELSHPTENRGSDLVHLLSLGLMAAWRRPVKL